MHGNASAKRCFSTTLVSRVCVTLLYTRDMFCSVHSEVVSFKRSF